ncbi:armadillo-like helical domain-containing protein 4 isoform X1 [Hirundo rustica]|uniref:armadillo-like helical domain-containing protein 4 isoform X1 n=2 Tax=Hirundo rustica TaxID=43150 RepID=UPI001A93E1E3|nr:armadillo-like helical domain-containing protein 4 isoform X1 [Hirundo rustica]
MGGIKPSVCSRDLVLLLTLGSGEQEEAQPLSSFVFGVEVSGFVSLASFWTHLLSAMRRSKGFDICVVTCSILLLSSSLPCLAQPLEERDVPKVQHGPWAGNGLEDERTVMVDSKNNLGPTEQTVSGEPCVVSAKPSGAPLDEAFTTEGEALPASPSRAVPSSQGLGGPPSAGHQEELAPTEAQLEEDEALSAMLTTAVTTLSPPVQEEAGEATTEGGVAGVPSSAGPSATPLFSGTAVEEEEEAESSSQPTLSPSSPRWEAAGDGSVIPTLQAAGATPELGTLGARTGSPLKSLVPPTAVATKHPLVVTEALLHPEAGTGVTQQELPTGAGTVTVPSVDTVPPDWDDTKLGDLSQGGSRSHEEVTEELGTAEPPQTSQEGVGEEEDAPRAVPSPVSPPPAPELAKESNCTVRGEELPATSTGSSDAFHMGNLSDADTADLGSVENISAVTAEEEKSIPPSQPEAAVVTDTQPELSPTLESSWKGVTQEVTTAAQEADAALSAVTEVPGATQGAGAASFPQENSGEDTQMLTAPSATEVLVAAGASSTVSPVAAEDLTDGILVTSEKAVPAPGEMSSTPAGQTEEASSRTVVLVTPASSSSVRRTALPSVRRISTAVTYGLDRLESEEGEEEEEDEEEEEEEEGEEEEDEEDKDLDVMDESMEGDTELPGFTLPGETSQEPLAGLENPVAQLAGVSYQVPDTIEWEQQNQGLVRSWMEKLKDKAGYMSGMLVPVGVGIAGALFILGALYSIKIMNRRRRNGSKRHKRKQREFNSMQDRVMLLADSSEDEF